MLKDTQQRVTTYISKPNKILASILGLTLTSEVVTIRHTGTVPGIIKT